MSTNQHENSATRPFEISDALYPFTSRFLTIEGLNVHYIDEGEGHPIVFCHGNPSWSLLYAPIIRKLRERYRCIAIDYPDLVKELKAAYLAPYPTPESRMGTAVFPRQIIASSDWLAALDQRLKSTLRRETHAVTVGRRRSVVSRRHSRDVGTSPQTSHDCTLTRSGAFFQQDAPDEIVQAMIAFG